MEFQGLTGQYYGSKESVELYKKEGPKYQYKEGCLADGIIGVWFASMAQVPLSLDKEKIKSHLQSVFKYNYKSNLYKHSNPQRPGFALAVVSHFKASKSPLNYWC